MSQEEPGSQPEPPVLIPVPGRYVVTPRGTPDPANARYAVLDYGNQPAARAAAAVYCNYAIQPDKVLARQLKAALDGEDPDTRLQAYDIVDLLDAPGARLLVLDYVHDYVARLALRHYADGVQPDWAERIVAELSATQSDYSDYMVSRSISKRRRRRKN